MLAYAAHRRTRRRLSPTALGLIIGGHVLAVGLLVTARMDTGNPFTPTRTQIVDIPLPPPPPDPTPPPPKPQPQQQATPQPPNSFIETVPPVVPLPQPGPTIEVGPSLPQVSPDIGKVIDTPLPPPLPQVQPVPAPPVRVAARAITPSDLLRPPYPDAKRRSEEEAVLRLRLGIDPRGRVTSVEPVGAADPDFLAAARGHLLRHWRYKPATEDGRPVATTITITLRFELEE